MEKKVSAKEKLYQKAIAYVEKMMTEGHTVTRAREMATVKFGISNPTMIKMTMHLSPKN